MNSFTMFLILALLASLWWLLRKRRAGNIDKPAARVRAPSEDTQFHAVSIKYSGTACQAAMEMSGRRFLATAAPKLPLPACDVLECTCRFAHHQDRRSHKDRRSPFGPAGVGASTGSYNTEQRDGEDRRKGEH